MSNTYSVKRFYNSLMQHTPMLYGYQFILTFSGTDFDDGSYIKNEISDKDLIESQTNLTYRAQSATIPSISIDKASIPFYGIKFNTPTVIKFRT